MAVTVGTVTNGARAFGNTRTMAHTTDVGVYRVMLVWVFNSIAHDVTAITYGGEDILANVLIDNVNWAGNDARVHCFYMIAPPIGPADVVYTLAGNCTHACSAQAWVGDDPYYPFGVPVTATGNDALITVDVNSEADEKVVDGACFSSGAPTAITLGAGQTELARANSGAGGATGYGSSYETGAATNTMSWGLAAACNWATGAVALRPLVPFAERPIEYTIDVWDPEQRMIDSAGHVVPRYKIKPNRWGRLIGLERTTAEVYENNYEDPALFYNESVQYDGEADQAQIVINRGDLLEVMMARLASGSTG